MLKEIVCDKFNSAYRRITLKPGLNTVLGTNQASNSIGKSTFLMILDFIFGGEDYIDLLDDVHEEVGYHAVKFMFEFDGEQFRFVRTTEKPSIILRCEGEDYCVCENQEMKLSEYCSFLSQKYGLNHEDQTLRNTVSRFIRVFPRDTMDRKKPLSEQRRQPDKTAIENLLKIMGLYSEIKEKQKVANECSEKLNAFKGAQKYRFVPEKDGKENLEELIDGLEKKRRRLLEETSFGMTDYANIKESRLSGLQIKLATLKRNKTALQFKLESIKLNQNSSERKSKKEYESLKRFFPSVEIEEIEKIDAFHNGLISILQKDISSYEIGIREEIRAIDEDIESVEAEFEDMAKEDNTSKIVLKEFAETDNTLRFFKTIKKNEKLKKVMETDKDIADKEYENLVLSAFSDFEKNINTKMEEINDIIYQGTKTAPILNIDGSKKYTFRNPKDGGSGTSYRGLIVFDLAMLRMTRIPVIVHDSDMLKLIQDDAVENILELYNSANCQVFISLDKKTSYPENAQRIIEESSILKLLPESGALFGRTWNTKRS